MLENIDIMTVNYRHIENLQILSFNELPIERQILNFDEDTQPIELVVKVLKLVELALLDPKRVQEFDTLTPNELADFYLSWVKSSEEMEMQKEND